MRNNKGIITFTGVPGIGKSTVAGIVDEELNRRGIKTEFITDYFLMEAWAKEVGEDMGLAKFRGKTFFLDSEAYGVMWREVVPQLGRLALEKLDEGKSIVILEGARGVFRNKDNYIDHLFEPLSKIIAERGLFLGNVEVTAEPEVLWDRVQEREDKDSAAPPAEITLRYLDQAMTPFISSSDELGRGGHALGAEILFNFGVSNSRDIEEGLSEEIEGLSARLLEQLNGGGVEGGGDYFSGKEK